MLLFYQRVPRPRRSALWNDRAGKSEIKIPTLSLQKTERRGWGTRGTSFSRVILSECRFACEPAQSKDPYVTMNCESLGFGWNLRPNSPACTLTVGVFRLRDGFARAKPSLRSR